MTTHLACVRARITTLLSALVLMPVGVAHAAPGSESCPELTLEAGVVSALPALMEVGQMLGGMAALTVGYGPFLYGVRASVAAAEEYSQSWRVSHTEVRLRALGGVRAAVGRGTWILRLGLGLTVVHEERERHDVEEVGVSNVVASDSASAAVPAVDLEGGLVLHLAGDWGLALFAGPTLHFGPDTGGARWGYTGSVALVWTP